MEAPPPLDVNYIPSVHITELPASAPISEILSVLDLEGGLILKDLVSLEDLAAIENEVSASTSDQKSSKETHDGFKDFIPAQTILVGGLVGKSATAARFCEHPVLEELRKSILTDQGAFRMEDYDNPYHIDPLLSISLSFCVGHDAPRQKLHRDDVIHLVEHNKPFELNKASQFACLVAGVETTRENGATMFVPGSHRWDDKREPKLDEVTFAEMKPGSALIFLASAWHGGGHNSVPGVTRVVHGFFFCRGIYRTEENQFLAIPRSKALMMSPKMLHLLGYKQPLAALGLVENGDPMKDIYGTLQAASS